jgi:hypothetical protein
LEILALPAGVDDLHGLLARVKLDKGQDLLEDGVTQKIAAKIQFLLVARNFSTKKARRSSSKRRCCSTVSSVLSIGNEEKEGRSLAIAFFWTIS